MRQDRSVEIIHSAPDCIALFTFCSAIAMEIGSYFTENVPPKPQQVSTSFISTSSSPATFASNFLGSSFIWHSRKPAHESWYVAFNDNFAPIFSIFNTLTRNSENSKVRDLKSFTSL